MLDKEKPMPEPLANYSWVREARPPLSRMCWWIYICWEKRSQRTTTAATKIYVFWERELITENSKCSRSRDLFFILWPKLTSEGSNNASNRTELGKSHLNWIKDTFCYFGLEVLHICYTQTCFWCKLTHLWHLIKQKNSVKFFVNLIN